MKMILATLAVSALAVPALVSGAPSAPATASAATPIKQPGVASCLKKRFGSKVYTHRTPNPNYEHPSPPLSFGKYASGGWVIVDMPQAQEVTLLFYRSMLEADRTREEIVGLFVDVSRNVVFRHKNVFIIYEHKPTKWERRVIARCIPA